MQKNVLEMLFAAVVPTVHRPACSVAACGGCCCNVGVLPHRDRKNSVRVKVDRREVVICRPKSRFFLNPLKIVHFPLFKRKLHCLGNVLKIFIIENKSIEIKHSKSDHLRGKTIIIIINTSVVMCDQVVSLL